jgi:4-methyl-5(b-hydroxyethyl)-thiazole monophosphate biosynthesis
MKHARPTGVLVAVAHGSESLETVAIVNVLRRAELEVTLASIETDLVIAGTRGVRFAADKRLLDARDQVWQMIVLPGGEKGADALGRHMPLIEMLHAQDRAELAIAAICAAPALTLASHHLLDRRRATCYPAFKARLPQYVDEAVVSDGHYITSQGPGTAIPFALALVERLAGKPLRDRVATALLVQ